MKKREFITLAAAAAAAAATAISPSRGQAEQSREMEPLNTSILYDLGEHGWSSFTLRVGNKSVDVGTFGYTTNALDDLILTGLQAAVAAPRSEASFDGEPMEWRLILDETWKPLARLRILTFEDIDARMPEEKGQVDFEARVNPDDYARAVQSVGHDIWKKYGAQGYREAWNGSRGFPLKSLRALDAALSTSAV